MSCIENGSEVRPGHVAVEAELPGALSPPSPSRLLRVEVVVDQAPSTGFVPEPAVVRDQSGQRPSGRLQGRGPHHESADAPVCSMT